MNKLIPCIGLLACSSLVAYAGHGDDKKPHVFVNPSLGYIQFDDDRELENAGMGSLGLEYRINENFSAEVVILDSTPESELNGADVDHQQLRLDGIYYLNRSDSWEPYLAAGVGKAWFDDDVNDEDESQFNLGGGVRYVIDDWFAYRADIRGIKGEDEVDAMVSIGFSAAFGGHERKKKVMAKNETKEMSKPMGADSDGDGINDSRDKCADTPEGVAVDRFGCPLDSDGDGIADYMDSCPDTVAGVTVDAAGCKVKSVTVATFNLKVQFENNSSALTPTSVAEVEKLAQFLAKYPSLSVDIEGHTDSVGSAQYNKVLSLRRAQSVGNLLTQKNNIAKDRVNTVGLGEEKPVASNETAEGRAQNRRVVVNIEKEVTQ